MLMQRDMASYKSACSHRSQQHACLKITERAGQKLVPDDGFEPPTYGLQNHRSTN